MRKINKAIAAAGLVGSLSIAGAVAAYAQNLDNMEWTGINAGSVSDQSWSSPAGGISRTNFANCGLNNGSLLSIPYPTWNVRHPGLFGTTAYVGEKSALCSRYSTSFIDWHIGSNQPANQLTLAKSVGTLRTTWNVVDK